MNEEELSLQGKTSSDAQGKCCISPLENTRIKSVVEAAFEGCAYTKKWSVLRVDSVTAISSAKREHSL